MIRIRLDFPFKTPSWLLRVTVVDSTVLFIRRCSGESLDMDLIFQKLCRGSLTTRWFLKCNTDDVRLKKKRKKGRRQRA